MNRSDNKLQAKTLREALQTEQQRVRDWANPPLVASIRIISFLLRAMCALASVALAPVYLLLSVLDGAIQGARDWLIVRFAALAIRLLDREGPAR